MVKNRPKTIVIGFDGASPKITEKWIQDLPNIRRFKEEGVLGETVPPIPAQTPVAWTTFMTGKNPGKHGIFSFAFRKIGTYDRIIIGTEMLEAKTLWRILGEAGKSVGVINMPMCDVDGSKGLMIPGFVSGSEGEVFPTSVKEKIQSKFGIEKLTGDLDIYTLDRVQSDPDLFFETVNSITDTMAEVGLYLIQEEEWDVFCIVFMGMDRIHHFFWKNLDPDHPKYEETTFSDQVRNFYVKADRIIGNFIEQANDETLVVLVSDHGFCPVHGEVIVNNYLEEAGHLRTKTGKIDLESSMAVSYGYGDIWLNVKGREPKGLVDPKMDYERVRAEIAVDLKKIEVDGVKPIKEVRKREELYWGTYLNRAPDLTAVFNTGWQAARQPEIAARNKEGRYVNENPKWSGGHDGTHDPADVPGILGLLGSRTTSSEQLRVPLWDVAPTILAWMHVPVPPDMDGKPVKLWA